MIVTINLQWGLVLFHVAWCTCALICGTVIARDENKLGPLLFFYPVALLFAITAWTVAP